MFDFIVCPIGVAQQLLYITVTKQNNSVKIVLHSFSFVAMMYCSATPDWHPSNIYSLKIILFGGIIYLFAEVMEWQT